jgi:hypothetical protein
MPALHRLVALALFGVGAAHVVPAVTAQVPAVPAPSLLQTSPSRRQQYLAHAVVWKPGGIPTPDQIRTGPPGRSPIADVEKDANGEVSCTYAHGGVGSTGKTAKFTCRLADGRSVRVKYYDGNVRTGNREVFAEILATRLFWTLGFDADAVYPVVIQCLDCPADPMNEVGPRARRRYLGIVQAHHEGTIIASKGDRNQGWTFGEVRAAIATLPAGETRARQSVQFDALALLATFVQHGDRKPEQQRLVCRSALDLSAGDLHSDDDDAGFHLGVLLERADRSACAEAMLTVQDLGATFGGAGQFTLNVSAKAHLSSWASTPVFAPRRLRDSRGGQPPPCRGNLSPSMSAGLDADANPIISDAGRRFLHDRLAALSPDHVRALFHAAHIDELKETHEWKDPRSGQRLQGIEAWVAAFSYKVEEIGRTSCPS